MTTRIVAVSAGLSDSSSSTLLAGRITAALGQRLDEASIETMPFR